MISALAHGVKNAMGVRGAAHLVELNLLLGRPEGPTAAPGSRLVTSAPSASHVISVDGQLVEGNSSTTHNDDSCSFDDDFSGSSPQVLRPSAGVFRGVRIQREHYAEFPLVLIGYGGGLFVANMAAKDREDCLFTLQRIMAKVEYMPGNWGSLVSSTEATNWHRRAEALDLELLKVT